MKYQHLQRYLGIAALVVVLLLGNGGAVFADDPSSTHYKATETQFNSGLDLKDCSSHYCSKISIGDQGVDVLNGTSTNYQAQFGSDTSGDPELEVITESGTNNLGVLDATHTASVSRVVKVRNYKSNGYTIQLAGAPPSQGEHNLSNLTTPTASSAGTEQFGVNLRANTTPSVGADVVQVPSTQTSFGEPVSGYNTANLFKYIDGDIIASSASTSGETDYTLSMIVNVSNATPGGHYDGSYSAVVVPVY